MIPFLTPRVLLILLAGLVLAGLGAFIWDWIDPSPEMIHLNIKAYLREVNNSASS